MLFGLCPISRSVGTKQEAPMKLKTLCTAVLLATGSVGVAYATPNLIQNGDFSQTTSPKSEPTQFGGNSGSGHNGSGSCTYGGQFVQHWSGNGGYGLWYSSATAASGTTACNQYNGNPTQRLPDAVTAPPVGSGSFIGLDGQTGINFGVSQVIGGLTPGANYTVSFYWAETQEMSREGPTSEVLQVALGNEALFSAVNACDLTAPAPTLDPDHTYRTFAQVYDCDPAPPSFTGQYFQTDGSTINTHGWKDWMYESFTFTADSTSSVLSFLSIGTPTALPPFAVLTGVSMTKNVPDPSVLGMFGGGLLGLGMLTLIARRRALRRGETADGDAIG
jgi:hypothetical protein